MPVDATLDARLRHRSRRQLAAYLALGFFVLLGFAGTAKVRQDDCIRADKAVTTIRTIVKRSGSSLEQLHAKGQISDALYAASKEQNAKALRDLKAADCSFFAG